MTGVEILNIYQVEVDYVFNWRSPYFGWGLFSLFVAVALALWLMWWLDAEPISGIFIGLALVVPFLLIPKAAEPVYETHYDIIIDDSVSLNELNKKYEIIDVRGKIYEVKERNDTSE